MTYKHLFSFLIVSSLVLCSFGCSKISDDPSPNAPSAETSDAQHTTPSPEPAHQARKSERENHTERKSSAEMNMCETVPPTNLTAITGIEYPTVNSTANFPTIKHCEYFSEDGNYSVSLLVAFDETATQRMEQNRQYPGIMTVTEIGDDALWEPAQGALTVLDKNRCAVVMLSPSHGDDATRRKHAVTIAQLILDRY